MALRSRVLREAALVSTLFVLYRQVRFLTRNDTGTALANADRVVRAEQWAGLYVEPTVQRLALHNEALVAFLNRYYVSVHFPLTACFLAWVLVRHADRYRTIRLWFVTVTGAALAIHVGFPLAPPRMLAGEHFVDTLQRYGPQIYPADPARSIANQFAAMPSLHFGWALLVALGCVAIKRTKRSMLTLLHPAITLFAIVATANHYLLDALVAGVLVVVAVVLTRHRPFESLSRRHGQEANDCEIGPPSETARSAAFVGAGRQ